MICFIIVWCHRYEVTHICVLYLYISNLSRLFCEEMLVVQNFNYAFLCFIKESTTRYGGANKLVPGAKIDKSGWDS